MVAVGVAAWAVEVAAAVWIIVVAVVAVEVEEEPAVVHAIMAFRAIVLIAISSILQAVKLAMVGTVKVETMMLVLADPEVPVDPEVQAAMEGKGGAEGRPKANQMIVVEVVVRWTAAFAGVRGLRKAVAEAVAEAVVTVVKMILEVVVLDLAKICVVAHHCHGEASEDHRCRCEAAVGDRRIEDVADLLHEGVVDNRYVMVAA